MPGVADDRMREIRERRNKLRYEREHMAEPRLQIERKVERLELGLSTLAAYISPEITEEVDKILRGENDASQEDTGRVSVRDEGETVQGQGSESEGSEAGQSNQGQPGEE